MKEILYAVLVLGVMGALLGGVLAIASKVFAVKVDERLPKLTEALPGANCGGCGFAGCGAYAQAVLDGKAPIGLCAAGGAEAAKKMSEIMGVQAVEVEKTVAMVKCRGKNHLAKGVYDGIADCRSAMFVTGNGPTACPLAALASAPAFLSASLTPSTSSKVWRAWTRISAPAVCSAFRSARARSSSRCPTTPTSSSPAPTRSAAR